MMSIQALLFRYGAGKSDRKRDSIIPLPAGVKQISDVSYGPYGKWNLLDVYYPAGAEYCPVIQRKFISATAWIWPAGASLW